MMKSAIMVLMAALSLTSFHSTASATRENQKFCSQLGELGNAIMTARQNGRSEEELTSLAGGDIFALAIINDAVKVQRWGSKKRKEQAAFDFGNKVFRECVQELNQK